MWYPHGASWDGSWEAGDAVGQRGGVVPVSSSVALVVHSYPAVETPSDPSLPI